jgi:hypothetical protein
MTRKIRLRPVGRDSDQCTIDASRDDAIAFRGDAVDAPTLCCGTCEADLVIGVDRSTLANAVIVCKRCGTANDTREYGMNQSSARPGSAL